MRKGCGGHQTGLKRRRVVGATPPRTRNPRAARSSRLARPWRLAGRWPKSARERSCPEPRRTGRRDRAAPPANAAPYPLIKGRVVMSIDRRIGDFAQADVLIEDGEICEVGPNLAVSADAAVVVDASNRIVIPGFIDTHSHSYQGLLRNIMPNGLLSPDYNRDVQSTLTSAYGPEDAYAGELITALGMIEMGTTTIVDISQVSHTPEHSNACIRALKDRDSRCVLVPPGRRAACPLSAGHHAPAADLFQLEGPVAHACPDHRPRREALCVGARGRRAGCPGSLSLGKDLSAPLLELGRAGLLRPGDEYIHCLGLNDAAWQLIKKDGRAPLAAAPRSTWRWAMGRPLSRTRSTTASLSKSELRPRRGDRARLLHHYAIDLDVSAQPAISTCP